MENVCEKCGKEVTDSNIDACRGTPDGGCAWKGEALASASVPVESIKPALLNQDDAWLDAHYKAMVDRFLGWKLPGDFSPDGAIYFIPPSDVIPSGPHWPSGTNLFHAGQALEMFKHCLSPELLPLTPQDVPKLTPEAIPARVTPCMITAAIVGADYHVLPGTQITVCTITLRNGTKVLGYNYGAIDPSRQNWEQGRQAAYAMAREKIWELEGYLLRERLATASATLEVAADPEADKAAQVLEVVLDFFRSVEDRTINLDPPYAEFLDRLARAIGWEFNENPEGEEAQP